jgi:hypothetical protein
MPILPRKVFKPRPRNAVTDSPLNKTVPLVGSTKRLIHRISVDFPAPDKPITATNSPADTSRSTPFKAQTFLS